MGDAIYEMYVRQSLIGRHPGRTTHDLHIMATRLVRAGAQAFTAAALMDRLTEEERGYSRRGRNMHNATVPKHADVGITARPPALRRCWISILNRTNRQAGSCLGDGQPNDMGGIGTMSRTSLKWNWVLSHTPHPDEVVATGAGCAYSSAGVEDLIRGVAEKDQSKYLQRIVDMGHLSPSRHASFTFAVEGVSRAAFGADYPAPHRQLFRAEPALCFPRPTKRAAFRISAALYRGVGAGSRSRVRPADGDHAEMGITSGRPLGAKGEKATRTPASYCPMPAERAWLSR